MEFEPWPKIHRLFRDILVTEKIDGTNGCIVIEPIEYDGTAGSVVPDGSLFGGGGMPGIVVDGHVVYAQSRKKILSPGKATDNFGFAGFVRESATELFDALGPGRHYGEWYGSGIQRNYGLDHKRFALFNAERWRDQPLPQPLETVPILYDGVFSQRAIEIRVDHLRNHGSRTAPGFKPAEGVVVYHKQGNVAFKVTCDNDYQSKGEFMRAVRAMDGVGQPMAGGAR